MRKLFIHLKGHVCTTLFKGDLIVLDLKQDKYFILDPEKFALLKQVFNSHWKRVEDTYESLAPECEENVKAFLDELLRQDWVEHELYSEPYQELPASQAQGVEEIDWRLPIRREINLSISISVLRAVRVLASVHFTVRRKGFYGLIQKIERQSSNLPEDCAERNVDELVQHLNQACLIYPVRTKCLEWATAFTLLGLKKGWPCRLNVGVQNYPFLAHAWATLDGEVVADSATLPDDMAVILETPNDQRGEKSC